MFTVCYVALLTSDSSFTYAPGPGPMSCLSGHTCQAQGTAGTFELDSLIIYLTIDSDSAFHGPLPLSPQESIFNPFITIHSCELLSEMWHEELTVLKTGIKTLWLLKATVLKDTSIVQ